MERRHHIIITVDPETAQWARVYAARHGTSVSKIVGEMLEERRQREEGYDRAMKSFFARGPRRLSDANEPYPTRDDLQKG